MTETQGSTAQGGKAPDWIKAGCPSGRFAAPSPLAAVALGWRLRPGKSHLLIALGTAAAEKGFRVKYTLATRLVNELVEAADEKNLARTIARFGRVDLLMIDEIGYMELDRRGAELLFQVLNETGREQLHRDRLERILFRLDKDTNGPATLRGDRRPADIQRHHHRNRDGLILPRTHSADHGRR